MENHCNLNDFITIKSNIKNQINKNDNLSKLLENEKNMSENTLLRIRKQLNYTRTILIACYESL